MNGKDRKNDNDHSWTLWKKERTKHIIIYIESQLDLYWICVLHVIFLFVHSSWSRTLFFIACNRSPSHYRSSLIDGVLLDGSCQWSTSLHNVLDLEKICNKYYINFGTNCVAFLNGNILITCFMKKVICQIIVT